MSERFQYIFDRNGKYSVKEMCLELTVTESGYYKWIKHKDKKTKRELLPVEIKKIYDEHEDNENYGIERIKSALKQKGIERSRSTIYRTMKEGGYLLPKRVPHGMVCLPLYCGVNSEYAFMKDKCFVVNSRSI